MVKRITITDLRDTVKTLNERCKADGIAVRLFAGGRNGYQAIDEYPVDSSGERIGTGVNRTVCCGTSRECIGSATLWYYQTSNKHLRGTTCYSTNQ